MKKIFIGIDFSKEKFDATVIKAEGVEEVAESLAVAARVLAAEQPQACVRFVRNTLQPPEQTAQTAHLVFKHLVLSLFTFLDSFGLNDLRSKLCFGKIYADKVLFDTFVANSNV